VQKKKKAQSLTSSLCLTWVWLATQWKQIFTGCLNVLPVSNTSFLNIRNNQRVSWFSTGWSCNKEHIQVSVFISRYAGELILSIKSTLHTLYLPVLYSSPSPKWYVWIQRIIISILVRLHIPQKLEDARIKVTGAKWI